MERLTEKRHGENVIPLRSRPSPRWALSKQYDTPDQFLSGEAADRLAAYEDTGFTPEAGAQLKKIAEIFNCDLDNTAQLKELCDKLRGWRQAEQDGRLVVLPCKVGDTVYRLLTPTNHIIERKIRTIGEAADVISTLNKEDGIVQTYLTRQEAEAAMERREKEVAEDGTAQV